MRIKTLLLSLLLIVAASAQAAVGDIISLNKLSIGTNGETPKECTQWKTYQWDGLLKCIVTSESPKECMLYGAFDGNTGVYTKSLNDNDGQLEANESCHLVVPTEVGGYKVVGAHSFALYKIPWLTSVQFPEGVRVVENPAVHGCDNLTYVSLPSTIEEIGQTSFAYCDKLKYIYINRATPPTVGANSFAQRIWNDTGEWVVPDRKLYVPFPANYDIEPWTQWVKSENILCSDINISIAGIWLTGTDEEAADKLLEDLAELDEGLMEDFFEGIPEIHYDEATTTLTLKDFRMTIPADRPGIMNGIFNQPRTGVQGLKVEIQGECELRGNDNMIFDTGGGIQLVGDGTLKIKAGSQGARVLELLSIDGPDVEIESTDVAIFADNIDGTAKVAVQSGSLRCFGKMSMQQFQMGEGIKIWEPYGASYFIDSRTDTYGIVIGGAFVTDQWIVIEQRELLPFALLGDTPSVNQGDDLVSFIQQANRYYEDKINISGSLYYQDGKLYMDNFQMEYNVENAYRTFLKSAEGSDLEIVLSGDNSVSGVSQGLEAQSNVTLSSPSGMLGGLSLNATMDAIFISNGCKVTCQDVDLTAEADLVGIMSKFEGDDTGVFEFCANDDDSNQLKLFSEAAPVMLNPDKEGCFIIPDNYTIVSPDNAVIKNNMIVDADDQPITNEWIVIAKKPSRILPIGIAYQQITDETDWDELNSFLADSYGMTGSISFDDESHTLTLDNVNATSEFEGGGFIEVYDAVDFPGYEHIAINIKGDNCIENRYGGSCLMLYSNNVSLTGNGTLTLKNSMEYEMDNFLGCAISMFGGEDAMGSPMTLTIDGPTLKAEADNSLALYIEGCLVVESGELQARGLLGPLYVSDDLMAGAGIGILSPEGAYYNPDNGYIMQGDEYVQGDTWFVMGASTPTNIEMRATGREVRDTVFDLQGRRINGKPSRGIYVVGTRKVVAK